MPQVINTNVSALNSQRNLNMSQSSLAGSLQRLSSGLRINSAKDDAAGMAIASRMTAQYKGQDQAVRNANDAISLAQTAEAALGEMETMLQRMRVLAVQSANATNTAVDRAALNNEVVALSAELDRLANSTSFNGQVLLDGNFGSAMFQVGANAGQVITTSLTNLTTTQYGNQKVGNTSFDGTSGVASLGTSGTTVAASQTGLMATVGGNIILNGSVGTATVAVASGATQSAKKLAQDINAAGTGIRATAKTEATFIFGASDSYVLSVTGGTGNASVSFAIGATVDAAGLAAAVTAFNDKSSTTGVTARLNAGNNGVILTSADGSNITLGQLTAGASISGSIQVSGGFAGTSLVSGASGALSVAGRVQLDSDKTFSVNASSVSVSGLFTAFGGQTSGATEVGTLQAVNTADVTTVQLATTTIRIAESALANINSLRATLGATQNRFDAVTSSLASSNENLAAARSRIQDADFAAETTNLSRSQILQQAGIAALAQANALPNNVLALLK